MNKPYRIPRLQTLWRILVIPWLFAFAIVSSFANHEDYAGAQFISWLDFAKQSEFRNQVHLVGSVPYEFIIFMQMKPPYATLQKAMDVRARFTIMDAHGKRVSQLPGLDYASGVDMDREGMAEVLGSHINALVNDHATDPDNRQKVIQNTSIFKVAKTGTYQITTRIQYHPPAWRIGLVLNTHATLKWYIWLNIMLLYFPFFVGQEIYYLIKLRKWRTWPSFWYKTGKDIVHTLLDQDQEGKNRRK